MATKGKTGKARARALDALLNAFVALDDGLREMRPHGDAARRYFDAITVIRALFAGLALRDDAGIKSLRDAAARALAGNEKIATMMRERGQATVDGKGRVLSGEFAWSPEASLALASMSGFPEHIAAKMLQLREDHTTEKLEPRPERSVGLSASDLAPAHRRLSIAMNDLSEMLQWYITEHDASDEILARTGLYWCDVEGVIPGIATRGRADRHWLRAAKNERARAANAGVSMDPDRIIKAALAACEIFKGKAKTGKPGPKAKARNLFAAKNKAAKRAAQRAR